MSILIDVFKELLGMFLADARLTAAVLVLVGAVGWLVRDGWISGDLGGGLLLAGCLLILTAVVFGEARRRR